MLTSIALLYYIVYHYCILYWVGCPLTLLVTTNTTILYSWTIYLFTCHDINTSYFRDLVNISVNVNHMLFLYFQVSDLGKMGYALKNAGCVPLNGKFGR